LSPVVNSDPAGLKYFYGCHAVPRCVK
jgi:hypothetical protein